GRGDATAALGPRCGYALGRECDDAPRFVDLFEAPHDLGLLDGQPFGRKRLVGRVECRGPRIVEPTAQVERPPCATLADSQVIGPFARHERQRDRVFRKMTSTKDDVRDSHGCSSRLYRCSVSSPAGLAAAGWPETGALERSTHSAPSWR